MQAIQSEYFSNIDNTIDEIKRTFNDPIAATNKIVEVLEEKVIELQQFLITHKFNSVEEEIHFFKEQKPRLIAKLIYHNLILEIEANMPLIKKDKIDFIELMLNEISLFTQRNKIFYQYYRSNATHNDTKYFMRFRDGKLRYYETHIINYDIRFCTSHDYNVSQFMANEMIVAYLERKLDTLNNYNFPNQTETNSNLNWTGSRIDLIEIIYAFHTLRVINSGKTDIKELAAAFGKVLNIELQDYVYRDYYDIKNRKNSRIKFIDTLGEYLNKRLNEEDA
ncbi:MAG: RteC domain-containing protein [Flavobacterium sp.]|nr:RteC domain-containing protein [Flavobacterium sp.]